MRVQARLYGFGGSIDAPPEDRDVELPEGATVADLIAAVGVRPEEVEFVMVGQDFVERTAVLRPGDLVRLSGPDDLSSVGG